MSQIFLERDYLLPKQTVDQRVNIICNAAEKILGIPGFAKRFKSNFKKGWYSLSTPIWTNFGTDRGLPISCYGSSISDSMESIASTWAEICMMTKHGGGTSAIFDLRGRGSKIRDNGESSGAVHFMQVFDNLINTVSQGKCYIEGTEVLTNSGFKDFREIDKSDKLAQVDEFNNVTFTDKYELVIEDFDGDLVCLEDEDLVSIKVTPNHRMVIVRKGRTEIVLARDLKFQKGDKVVLAGKGRKEFISDISNVNDANIIQAIASLAGEKTHSCENINISHEYYKGKVYCAVVPEGRLIVRHNGRVMVCGNTRRGNFAAYLPIDHHDIMEFLSIRSEGATIQDLSFGVCVPDYWMQEMIDGDWKKRKVWARVLECRSNTGFPYVIFIDTVNKNTVDVYKDKNLRVKHSNLCCVTGDQRVVSNRGLKTAKQLFDEGGDLVLFDNVCSVKASPMRLIKKNTDVYKITLDNGMTHTVTPCHKLKIRFKKGSVFSTTDVLCSDLKIGDTVAIQTMKGVFGSNDVCNEAFLLGLYQGDGTQTEKERMIDLWEQDFDLIPIVDEAYQYVCDKYNTQVATNKRTYKVPAFHECVVYDSDVRKKRLSGRALTKLGFEKNVIPDWIWEANERSQWAYVKGLFYTDGTVYVASSKGKPIQLSLANVDIEFLRQVQLILANLGMQSSIRVLREKGQTLLPDGRGGRKLYKTKTCYRLIVGNKNDAIVFDEKTGFLSRKKITIENRKYRNNTKKYYSVSNIEYAGKQDVYCCEVDTKSHYWICNGIITHNSEIMLPDDSEESFVCDLSSMNILYYDEWKDTDAVELLTFFLDAVMTDFINKAKEIAFMDRAVRFAERHRALGIGWLGWHSYLQSKMIAWESMEAKCHNLSIAKNIKEAAYAASRKLAEMYGEPEVLKGYGRRNTTLLAIAPTKSSAFILGQVSEGIEPHKTNYYIKDLQKGKFTIKNDYLQKLLESKGCDTEEIWDSILKHGGSVQHLSCLNSQEKSVFKTFSEISPKEIIIQAAQRQKFIDQSQSLNLMIDGTIPAKDVNALMIEAWQLGVKSLYYQMSVNAAQAFSRSILTCTSCES